MSRPDYITDEEIAALDYQIDNDDGVMVAQFKDQPTVRELFRAGLWLVRELEKLDCAPVLTLQFQYTHAKNSFGHEPWEQAEILLNEYLNNTYTIEGEPTQIVNS